MKKSIKGLIKTRHCQERQKQRKISDRTIKNTITKGIYKDLENGSHFILDHITVTVDKNAEKILTVHSGESLPPKKKILNKEQVSKLKKMLEKEKEIVEEEGNEAFLKYILDNSIKKI